MLMQVDFDTLTEGMDVEQKLGQLFEILENASGIVFAKKKEFIENKEEEEKKEEIARYKQELRMNAAERFEALKLKKE